MNKIIIISVFILSIYSCKTNNDKQNQYNLKTFFSITNWKDFNSRTLKRHNLTHFIKDSVDFFARETFFKFMKDSKYDNPYEDFYLVEIQTFGGERDYSRKILVINKNDKITSLGFEKNLKWDEINLTKDQINNYKYNSLTNSMRENDNEYVLITHIKGYEY